MKNILYASVGVFLCSSAFAACPSGFQGTEASTWSIEADFDGRAFNGDNSTGEHKTARITNLQCTARGISFRQVGASDRNNCSYNLTRNGGSLAGTETCPNGTYPVSGTEQ